jgi:nitroreductase
MSRGGDDINQTLTDRVPAILRQRRTIFHFLPDPIPGPLLERWLEDAAWVPNHHLTQPWAFYVLMHEAKRALADIHARLTAAKHADKPHVARIVEKARQEFLEPPVIVVSVQRGAATRDPVGRDEDYAAVCLATYNLMLAAWADGVGSYWSTGRLARAPETQALLGTAPDDRIVAIVRLGRPARVPPMQRDPVAPHVHWLSTGTGEG